MSLLASRCCDFTGGGKLVAETFSRSLIVGTGNLTAFYGQYPWQARIEVSKGKRGRP